MNPIVDLSLQQQLDSADSNGKIDALFAYMQRRGQTFYDASVTQLAHGLQTAQLARQAAAPTTLVTAALLHDLGHFLMDEHSGQNAFLHEDLDHEEVAADYLQPYFGRAVTEPIRLHVPAKRYLCTTDATYYDQLSAASQQSFQVQGGNLTNEERAELEANPHLDDALQLRRWDDAAKVADAVTAPLEAYREDLLACWKSP